MLGIYQGIALRRRHHVYASKGAGNTRKVYGFSKRGRAEISVSQDKRNGNVYVKFDLNIVLPDVLNDCGQLTSFQGCFIKQQDV